MNFGTAWLILTLTVFSTFAPNSAIASAEFGTDRRPRGAERLQEPAFVPIELDSLQVHARALDWGDYDNDGDLDFVITGTIAGEVDIARVYRNDSGEFVDVGAELFPCRQGSVEWGDFDADGDLDLLISGNTNVILGATRIYRNVAGAFELAWAADVDDTARYSTWADYDNDGDLDPLTVASSRIRLYRNTAGSFSAMDVEPSPSRANAATWLDYDGDDDLDLAIVNESGSQRFYLYENFAGALIHVETTVLGSSDSIEWGDFDSDGDPDLLLTGYGARSPGDVSVTALTRLLRNDEGTFLEVQTGMPGGTGGTGVWGDYDNDGDLDALLIGGSLYLYRNDGAVWTLVDTGFAHLRRGDAAWGDYDGDGDLDILVSGDYAATDTRTIIYRNEGQVQNTRPQAPTNLQSLVVGQRARLWWDDAIDVETASLALTYNVRIGSSPGAADLFSGMVDATTGIRRVAAPGNAELGPRFECSLPGPGTYYWSVQAIDAGFLGSPFALEQTLDVSTTSELVDIGGPDVTVGNFPVLVPGDYDADGDVDLLVVSDSETLGETGLYRNDGGTLNLVPGAFPASAWIVDAAWGDADGDGDLDLATVGLSIPGSESTVFFNEDGILVDSGAGLIAGVSGDVEWGDYDGDGDPDLLIYAGLGSDRRGRVYENQGGEFFEAWPHFEVVDDAQVEWGDYDSDGDLDILLVGTVDGSYDRQSLMVYRNDSGQFVQISVDEFPAYAGVAEWGDIDSDGDLDIVAGGDWPSLSNGGVLIYRNDAGTFTEIDSGISYVSTWSLALFDYDDNGELDIILGDRIYLGRRGNYVDSGHQLHAVVRGDDRASDFDADGDLDLFRGSITGQVRVLRHDTLDLNTAPSPPTGLTAELDGRHVTLSWNLGADSETPAAGLTYGLRVGTTPGGSELMHTTSDPATGQLLVWEAGNMQHVRSRTLLLPGSGEYHWSVQSIDGHLQGGAFSTEHSFVLEDVTAAEPAARATRLKAPHPNPFNARTIIGFTLATPSAVEIKVFDLAGRLVTTLLDDHLPAGEHTTVWDGCDVTGAVIGSGSYFCRMVTSDAEDTARLVLVK